MTQIAPLWGPAVSNVPPLWETMPLRPIRQESAGETETAEAVPFRDVFQAALDEVFGPKGDPVTDLFRSTVDAVKETEEERTQMEYLLASGQLDNPAALMIAMGKAQIAVDLMVQLRNKALDAYNELTRITL